MKSKLLATALTTLGLAVAPAASAVVIGGIDFGATGNTGYLATTTLSETFITGNGQNLRGYGQINTINGDTTYCASDPNCRLFFTFQNYISQNFNTPAGPFGSTAEFTGGLVNVYYAPNGAAVNLENQNSVANLAFITSQTPFVQFQGHGNVSDTAPSATLIAFGQLTGPNATFLGNGLLDVVVGGFGDAAVQAYFNSNGIPDDAGGLADAGLTTSGSTARRNQNDPCTFQAGQFCIGGSADIRGVNAVPEPGSLALLGVGFGVLGLIGRRKRKIS
jgi:hypothetical protein